ncbi:NUDIX domain-containing protein [Candidatus Jorgensenbacteria bacterium]|nr:NUDIX domain-containing protein [Candidatus Jorgensenbacteria bacterium]
MFYRIAWPIRKAYWFAFRPHTKGVKCLLQYGDEVLLIRNTYGRMHWTLPGGGVKKMESPECGIVREVEEEVGIKLDAVKSLGQYWNTCEYKRDQVFCFYARVASRIFCIDGNEVGEACWFPIQDLPDFLSPAVSTALSFMQSDSGVRIS